VSPLPAWLLTIVSSRAPCARSASISASGTPDGPKPPTSTVDPSAMPSTAASSVGTVLSIIGSEARGGAPARRF
jgi:hypothetical protein